MTTHTTVKCQSSRKVWVVGHPHSHAMQRDELPPTMKEGPTRTNVLSPSFVNLSEPVREGLFVVYIGWAVKQE